MIRRHPRAQFVAMLRQAVLDSYSCGYHKAPSPFYGAPPPPAPAKYGEGFRPASVKSKRVLPPCFVNWAKRPVGVLSDSWL